MCPIRTGEVRPNQFPQFSMHDLDLLGDPETGFDAITTLAAELFEVPVSLISIIDEDCDRQFFKSQLGLKEPWAGRRETPLSHSFCKHVKNDAMPLIVEDARENARVQGNLAISEQGVTAYLGVPIFGPDEAALGALCIIDGKARSWSKRDVRLLEKQGRCVSNEIRLKASAKASQSLFEDLKKKHEDTSRYNALREVLFTAFMAPDISMEHRFRSVLKSGCNALGLSKGVITKVDCDKLTALFQYNFPEVQTKRFYGVSGTLSSFLISGKSAVHFRDSSVSKPYGRKDFLGGAPASFAGVPLIVDGVVYGTLELSAPTPRLQVWSAEDISVLSMLSMLCSVYLGFVDKLDALQRSENALLAHMLDSQTKHQLSMA